MPLPHGISSICVSCTTSPPAYCETRVVWWFEEASREVIHRFKYADRTDALPFLSDHLRRVSNDLLAQADYLIPVPLHKKRLLARRYNQAALLAKALSRTSQARFAPDFLTRTRHTSPHTELGLAERQTNVQGLFTVPHVKQSQVEGKNILLIDDVITTGATMRACSDALRKAGAKEIRVLALARAVLF